MTPLYAYAVVPATLMGTTTPVRRPVPPPAGLNDAPVRIETESEVGAVVSALSDSDADPELIAACSADLAWLGERAAAHDRVVTWASDRGPAIPLPPFSLFRDAASVRRMLRERAPDLIATLGSIGAAREYTVRVFRIDSEMNAALASMSPAVADLEKRVAAATPGQRYLLERKLDGERETARTDVARRVAEEVLADLSRVAQRTAQGPLPQTPAAENGGAVLNASFLVAPDATQPFQAAVTRFIDRLGARGFRFEFTGPWPAYHFVGRGTVAHGDA